MATNPSLVDNAWGKKYYLCIWMLAFVITCKFETRVNILFRIFSKLKQILIFIFFNNNEISKINFKRKF